MSNEHPRWTVVSDASGTRIQDADFRHDVWLRMSGDFADAKDRDAFAAQVAFALNKEFGWDMASDAGGDEQEGGK